MFDCLYFFKPYIPMAEARGFTAHFDNGSNFDSKFLSAACIDLSNIEHFDMMLEFAPIYGEWDERRGDFKWKNLTFCADYYGYTFHAHDALEDCLATLHCYRQYCADPPEKPLSVSSKSSLDVQIQSAEQRTSEPETKPRGIFKEDGRQI